MKICLYSPYLPGHFGGGEKYLLDVATILAKQGQNVSLAVSPSVTQDQIAEFRQKYQTFFDLDLKEINFVTSPLLNGSVTEKLKWTAQFDVMYYLTDGSLFFSAAKKNILHLQIPFTHTMSTPLQRLKLFNWSTKNTNSYFTKQIIEKHWPTKIDFVHQPLVQMPWTPDEVETHLKHKQKIILNVGRFFRQLHSKRQDVMVEIFRELRAQHANLLRDWKLVFVGVVEDQSYADEVRALAKDLPIEFHHQVSRAELLKLYGLASFYWHATGYKVAEETEPEKVEHFGISTVEAMSYGAVPVVIGKGGQPEILGPDLSDNLWQTKAQCVTRTAELMQDTELFGQHQRQAIIRARQFDKLHFTQVLESMVYT